MSGLSAQNLNQTMGLTAGPETPSSLGGGNNGASPVTTITDATRIAIVNALSQCVPSGGRKYSFTSQNSPLSPQLQPNAQTASSAQAAAKLPSTQDLQRYVGAYLIHFHPHLPFLHIPTLSFDPSCPASGFSNGVGGNGCLMLPMAAIGALYETELAQSKELFDMAKTMVSYCLEERREADSRRIEARHNSTDVDKTPQEDDSTVQAPIWLVQSMLLNVVYGYNGADKTASDIASSQCAALVNLAQAAGLLRPSKTNSVVKRSLEAGDDSTRGHQLDQERHEEWLQWKNAEERIRTLYVVFIMSSLLVAAFNNAPALTSSEIVLDLPCDEEYYAAETSQVFFAKGGPEAADHNRTTFFDALGELLRTSEKRQKRFMHKRRQQALGSPVDNDASMTGLKPSTFGCLVLVNALHNYIWETRQRHHGEIWTDEETERMHRHIEPALKAWQMAWQSNPHHSVERPNPFGAGPLSADAIPLLDLAYVRLFVNLSRSREKFWQQDWDGVVEELARGTGRDQQAERPRAGNKELDKGYFSQDPLTEPAAAASVDFAAPAPDGSGTDQSTSRREQDLRKAAFYAADSLTMSDKLGVTLTDFTSRELPLQSALCVFDCAQILAEWIATLQDRVGCYLGILGQDSVDLGQVPSIILLEEEDVKLLDKVREILTSAELKLNMNLASDAMEGVEQASQPESRGSFATRILRLTASAVGKANVWPVTQLMARCLKRHADHAQARAEKSLALLN